MKKKVVYLIFISLLLFSTSFVSCDLFGADEELRSAEGDPVAWVIPVGGGSISPNAKSLSDGSVGLVSRTITNEEEVTNYLIKTDAPITTLIFKNVKSINCHFTDSELFKQVSTIIFVGTAPDVCENAFFAFKDHLTQVFYDVSASTSKANIGNRAFGPYSDEGGKVLISVPNRQFQDGPTSESAPDCGNYYYFLKNQMTGKEEHPIYTIYLASSQTEKIDPKNHIYKVLYQKKSERQTITIGTLPEIEDGFISKWDVAALNGVVVTPPPSEHEEEGTNIHIDVDVASNTHKIVIPPEEGKDYKAYAVEFVPKENFTLININPNWPSHIVSATNYESSDRARWGKIYVVKDTRNAYFTVSPEMPRDRDGNILAYWIGVSAHSDETARADFIFVGDTGVWELTEGTKSPYTENGVWKCTSPTETMFACWITPESSNGISFYRHFYEDDPIYWFEWQRGTECKVSTPSDFEAFCNSNECIGYTFNGWFYKGTNTPYNLDNSDVLVSKDGEFTSHLDIEAHWKSWDVDVEFNVNISGETLSPVATPTSYTALYNKAFNYSDGGSYTGRWSTPARRGYKFEGWFTGPEGDIEVTSDTEVRALASDLFTKYENRLEVTLYAKWTPYKSTIELIGHQDEYTSESDSINGYVVFEFDKPYYVSATDVGPATGFIIEGFYVGETTASDKVLGLDMQPYTAVNGWTSETDSGLLVWDGGLDDSDNTKELHTIWRIDEEYLVRFFKNWTVGSEDAAVHSQKITRGKCAEEVVSSTDADWMKTGYRFKGWYTTNTTFTSLTDNQKTEMKFKFEDTTITDDLDLYALWEPIRYTIEFDGNSDSIYSDESVGKVYGSIDPISILYDQDLTWTDLHLEKIFKPKLCLDGTDYALDTRYKFLGWSQNKGTKNPEFPVTGTDLKVEDVIKANLTCVDEDTVTLYAIWSTPNGGMASMGVSKVYLQLQEESIKGITCSPVALYLEFYAVTGDLWNDSRCNPQTLAKLGSGVTGTDKYGRQYRLSGFYTKLSGGEKVLNEDGSMVDPDLTTASVIRGYIVKRDGILRWVGGSAVLYAHWEKIV